MELSDDLANEIDRLAATIGATTSEIFRRAHGLYSLAADAMGKGPQFGFYVNGQLQREVIAM